MTELYIDGTSVVLPADFSTSVKRENPFLQKMGSIRMILLFSLVIQLMQTYMHI